MTTDQRTVLPDSDAPASGGRAAVVVGVVLVAVGVVMVREAFTVPVGRDLVTGARLFPAVITIVFLALSVCYLGQEVLRVARRHVTDGERLGDVGRVSAMVALLLAYGFLLEPVGYIVTTFVLFVAASRLLGSRQLRRDLVIGVALSVGIYVVFTQALAVRLPQGVIPLG